MNRALFLLVFLLGACSKAWAQDPKSCLDIAVSDRGRLTAVISDLHLGPGKKPNGQWDPREDFRWPDALSGFLNAISACGNNRVDLVIAGDLMELWQPPPGFECSGAKDSLGCTPAEMNRLVATIVARHEHVLRRLGAFAQQGANRLFVVPGNHDAALLLAEPWRLVRDAIKAPGRVTQVISGTWMSEDGRIVVEHGHQIGRDVNRFPNWPSILETSNGAVHFSRPWGEQFVQTLFNAEEDSYPVIDNLSPESAGARFRMADKGLWRSSADMARFISFNLFETTLHQKDQLLGDKKGSATVDKKVGRKLGHRLFAEALPVDDSFRSALLANSEGAAQLRKELDAMAGDELRLLDEEVEHLCGLVAQRSKGTVHCAPDTQGAALQSLLFSRTQILRTHLRNLLGLQRFSAMRHFVYAHTHLAEAELPIKATDDQTVRVLNTGAFQRVIDEEDFVALAKKRGLSEPMALKTFTVEDLAPCYSAVLIAPSVDGAKARTLLWHMREGAPGTGKFVAMHDPACKP